MELNSIPPKSLGHPELQNVTLFVNRLFGYVISYEEILLDQDKP